MRGGRDRDGPPAGRGGGGGAGLGACPALPCPAPPRIAVPGGERSLESLIAVRALGSALRTGTALRAG